MIEDVKGTVVRISAEQASRPSPADWADWPDFP
jgi:hypothetical protein